MGKIRNRKREIENKPECSAAECSKPSWRRVDVQANTRHSASIIRRSGFHLGFVVGICSVFPVSLFVLPPLYSCFSTCFSAGPNCLVSCDTPAVSGVTRPIWTSKSLRACSARADSMACSRLDLFDPFARQVGRHAGFATVQGDLVVDYLFDLAEVGRDVEVEACGQLGHFRLGPAHLQLSVVFGDLGAHIAKLFAGVLDLREIVVVRRLVQLELSFVFGELLLGLLQLQGEADAVSRSPAVR